jgi:hypothetical protein
MLTITTLVVLAVIGIFLYRHHTSLQPMSEQDVMEIHKKFHDAYKDVEPKPKINLIQDKHRHPTYLYLSQGHNEFLMLAWEKHSKNPSIKKYARDIHYYATHTFLEHFNIKPPQ